MLDVLRERESVPDGPLSPREFSAIAIDCNLPPTPINMLALMLAVGTGKFVQVEFAYG